MPTVMASRELRECRYPAFRPIDIKRPNVLAVYDNLKVTAIVILEVMDANSLAFELVLKP